MFINLIFKIKWLLNIFTHLNLLLGLGIYMVLVEYLCTFFSIIGGKVIRITNFFDRNILYVIQVILALASISCDLIIENFVCLNLCDLF